MQVSTDAGQGRAGRAAGWQTQKVSWLRRVGGASGTQLVIRQEGATSLAEDQDGRGAQAD